MEPPLPSAEETYECLAPFYDELTRDHDYDGTAANPCYAIGKTAQDRAFESTGWSRRGHAKPTRRGSGCVRGSSDARRGRPGSRE